MSCGYRAMVYGFFAHHGKHLMGAHRRVQEPAMKVVSDVDSCGESSPGVFPFSWMQLPREGCAKIQRRGAKWIKMVAPGNVAVNRNEYETSVFREQNN